MSHIAGTWKLVAAMSAFALVSPGLFAQHAGDIGVGRSAPGQLKYRPADPNDPICFDPSLGIATLTFYSASSSWRTDTPGFDANFESSPADDYFALATGASIRLVADEDMQPALRVKYQTQTILYSGDYISLGSSQLHRHPTFIVDANDPGYDPIRTLWWGTFTFLDAGSTDYLASAPFTIRLCVLNPNSFVVGDISGDGTFDFGDINPFVVLLTNPPEAATVQQRCAGDINFDGYADFGDINPFVILFTGG
jgi:hypothetical protein